MAAPVLAAGPAIGCAWLVGADFGNKTLCPTDDCLDDAGSARAFAPDGGDAAVSEDASDESDSAGDDADDGSATAAPRPGPVFVSNAIGIAAGAQNACAVLSGGTVTCWGDNSNGQLGSGGTMSSSIPVPVTGLTNATAVTIGGTLGSGIHVCALQSSGTVSCWGSNYSGELGTGTAAGQAAVPMVVPNLAGATAIAAGNDFTCALITGGTVQCWGNLSYGQPPADGGYVVSPPTAIPNLVGAISMSIGQYFGCAVLSDKTVACWGDGFEGELGNGLAGIESVGPVPVSGVTNATAVTAGEYAACALLSGGSVQCWGDNAYGELGTGTFASSEIAVAAQVSNAASVAESNTDEFACATLVEGTVQCWGRNDNGQLGTGSATIASPYAVSAPAAVPDLQHVVTVAAGGGFACALLVGGTVECWGDNESGSM
jgi:alpha-tubulin suppressor-like RCC1 family protein